MKLRISLQQILVTLCFLVPAVHAMEVEHAKEAKALAHQFASRIKRQIHRVPAYLYFKDLHVQITNAKPTLKYFDFLIHDQDIDVHARNMFKDLALALVAMEECLLTKSFKELTVEDINRLHALLVKDVTKLEGGPFSADDFAGFRGVYRDKDELINRKPEREFIIFAQTHPVYKKLEAIKKTNKISAAKALASMSTDEQELINQYMEIMPGPETIQDSMQVLVHEIQNKADQTDAFHIAAHVHQQMISIHPYKDGNGRMARLLANYILIKKNLYPIYFPNKERYKSQVKNSETEFAEFLARIEDSIVSFVQNVTTGSRAQVELYEACSYTLAGMGVDWPVTPEECKRYKEAFEKIDCSNQTAIKQTLQEFENTVFATLKSFLDDYNALHPDATYL